MLNIVFPTIPEVLELIYQLIRLIVLAIAIIFLVAAPLLLAVHLVHVHHIFLSLLAIQRFILYFFPNLEKFVSFGFKTTTKFIYFIHFSCFIPFPASFIVNIFVGVIHGSTFDIATVLQQLEITYHTSLNCIVISSALLYIPILISIFRLRHLPSIEKHKPHKYILYQTIILVFYKIVEAVTVSILKTDNNLLVSSVTDIFVTQLLVQIPYLFCNRRNVMAMRKRLSLKYLWSKIRHRNNQIAISHIQSTNF
ncbi:Protein CBG18629 [Caenorhabditis briggsae]|uniref:Protein CBG18629 n=1 Tax=Caenorhabditis briggsae TaxID=6238 RepID=A8XTR5_CAEBR|nr:Protein CBG18629 [Caenorhabditis briggsae]CAP36041.1 Protein CBG18629 [Caenorhabditis briggsae]